MQKLDTATDRFPGKRGLKENEIADTLARPRFRTDPVGPQRIEEIKNS